MTARAIPDDDGTGDPDDGPRDPDGDGTGDPDPADQSQPAALTARFEQVPASHPGSGTITVRVVFSEPVSTSYVTLRDDAFEVTGATVTGARRVDRRSDLWEITLRIDSTGDITITLPAERACDTTGAVCTDDGRRLSNHPTATIPPPPTTDDPPDQTANNNPPDQTANNPETGDSQTGNPETGNNPETGDGQTGDDETGEAPIWTATLTAGAVSSGHGYSSFTIPPSGSLTSTSFEIDGVTYTVNLVEAYGWMYIGLDRELPTGVTLEVNGTPLDSADATYTAYSYAHVYTWDDADMVWNPADTIELRLYLTP